MEKDEEQMPLTMTQVGDEKETLDIAEEKRPENANMKITFEMFGQKFYAVNGQPNDEPWKIALIWSPRKRYTSASFRLHNDLSCDIYVFVFLKLLEEVCCCVLLRNSSSLIKNSWQDLLWMHY